MTFSEFALYAGILAIFVVGILIGSTFGYARGQRDARAAIEAEKLAQGPSGTIVGLRPYARDLK